MIGVIIQARMGSTRLPGKVLMDINGKTMLNRIIERVRYSKLTDKIIIATSTNNDDDDIYNLAINANVSVYRGSPHDVLNRYFNAAKQFNVDTIVRITSDCPLIDPYVIDKVIQIFMNDNKLIATNAGIDLTKRTFPRGLDVEVFSFNSLSIANSNANEDYQREHVTPFFYKDKNEVSILKNNKNLSNNRWTVDTQEDLEFVRKVYLGFRDEIQSLDFQSVLSYIEKNPQLKEINQHILQKSHLETEL